MKLSMDARIAPACFPGVATLSCYVLAEAGGNISKSQSQRVPQLMMMGEETMCPPTAGPNARVAKSL